jgi:signal transduction histidine kinase
MESPGRKISVIPLKNHQDVETVTTLKGDQLLEFVAVMVHDLQGPIAGMKTIIKLLGNGRYDPRNKVHADLLGSSALALERAESIIYDLIDTAKSEVIGLSVSLDFYELDEIIGNSVKMLAASAFEYGVTIIKDVETSIKAQADRDLLLRVIDNIVFNAIKHSRKGGRIFVKTEFDQEYVIISVRDEGAGLEGINPQDLFDKYKQLDLRKEGKFKGAGLGLYFCRLAVDAMGGKIWAEQHPGGGACFKFSLIKDRRRG